MVNPIGVVLAGKKVGQALLKKFKSKKVADTISKVAPFSKTGAKSVSKWKGDAAKAKLESVKFNLDQTFKQSDTALNKLKKTTKILKGK